MIAPIRSEFIVRVSTVRESAGWAVFGARACVRARLNQHELSAPGMSANN